MNVATTASRLASSFVKPTLAELWHTELQWSLERIQTAKELVGDMLRWPSFTLSRLPMCKRLVKPWKKRKPSCVT